MSEIKELIDSLKVDFLKILADNTRLDILQLIKNEERTQEDLVKLLKKSQSTISQHLNLLYTNKLVEFSKKENKKVYRVKNIEIYNLLSSIEKFVVKNNRESLGNNVDSDRLDVLLDI